LLAKGFPACRLQLSKIRREWLSNTSTCQGSGAIPNFTTYSTPGGRRAAAFTLSIMFIRWVFEDSTHPTNASGGEGMGVRGFLVRGSFGNATSREV